MYFFVKALWIKLQYNVKGNTSWFFFSKAAVQILSAMGSYYWVWTGQEQIDNLYFDIIFDTKTILGVVPDNNTEVEEVRKLTYSA